MERFYFFTKTAVVLAFLSFFTLSFSSSSFASSYALAVTEQYGVDHADNILGIPAGNGAPVWTNNDYIIVQMSELIEAGSTYYLTWRMRSGEPGDARPYLYESSNGSTFNENPIANMTSSTNWVTSAYVAQQDFEFLKIKKLSSYSSDFDLDAVSCVSMEETPDLISTFEVTG